MTREGIALIHKKIVKRPRWGLFFIAETGIFSQNYKICNFSLFGDTFCEIK